MPLAKPEVPKAYVDSFEDLCSGGSMFMHVAPDKLPDSLRPTVSRDPSGLLIFELPLVEALGGTPQDITYALGTDLVADAEAHRDLIPPESLNCHYTLKGSMRAEGAVIADELHDEGGGLIVPMHEAVATSSIETIQADAGDVYLFFGGRVTHRVISGAHGRRSTMRHYVFES